MSAGRRSTADAALVRRVRAGDEDAFAEIVRRYQRPLLTSARRILRDDALAEDVLQESFWRAHRALRRDAREINLRPWLYRLVRNGCLDEISRSAPQPVDLADTAVAAPAAQEPDAVADRRLRVRRLLTDIADLPPSQRHALIRRELDGLSHDQVAEELGISARACISLVSRARTALSRASEARSTPCATIRQEIMSAHDERRRASVAAHRHMAGCADCRAFRQALGTVRSALNVLQPVPLLIGMAAGAKAIVAGKATSVKAAAGAAALATGATGVVIVSAGQPSPIPIHSRAVSERVAVGAPLPAGTSIVRQTVALRPGEEHEPLRLACPEDQRVADVLPVKGARATVTLKAGSVPHRSRSATLVFSPLASGSAGTATVSIFCKRPDASGSLVARPASAAARGRAGRARRAAMLYARPGGRALNGSVHEDQPLTVVSTRHGGGWLQVVTDDGQRGWLRASCVNTRPRRAGA